MKHKVEPESDAHHRPGWGTAGKNVWMMDYETATAEFSDLPRAVACPKCGYDRCKVTLKYNGELGDTVRATCGACSADLQRVVDSGMEDRPLR